MDRPISIDEVGERLSEIVRGVASDETFRVTSAGKPVAKILPAPENQDRERQRRGITALLDQLETLPVRDSGAWRRDELYER